MKLIKPSLCFALLILSACGGGSSSGGGSSQIKEKDGVFEGSQTLVISTKDGTIIDQANFGFSASVFENNIAIFDPSFLVEAEINNNRFRAETHTFELSEGDLTCLIAIVYDGIIFDELVKGALGGQYVCRNASENIDEVEFPISGSFEAQRDVLGSKVSLIKGIDQSLQKIINELNSAGSN